MRAAAAAAALLALVLLVGTATYLGTREEPPPPTTTTTTTLGEAEVAAAVAEALEQDLRIAVTREEAACVAHALVEVVPPEALHDIHSLEEPLAALAPDQRDALVRSVVRCLPPESAAFLLGGSTTTAPPLDLPDEG